MIGKFLSRSQQRSEVETLRRRRHVNLLLNGFLDVLDGGPRSYSDLLLLAVPYISKIDLEIGAVRRLGFGVIGLYQLVHFGW